MANVLELKRESQLKDELLQLVSFTIDREEFGVDVTRVREIIRLPNITQMPTAPGYVEGIINLRGSVIPVISMRERFGLSGIDSDSKTRIIVMSVGDETMGFKVDAVSEVIRISGSEVQPPPSMVATDSDRQCICGVINRAERLLIMLDPEKILTGAEKGQAWEAA